MIAVEHLTTRFPLPGGGSLVAVDDLSFTVQPGYVYGLLGPNCAAQTTTLRMWLDVPTLEPGVLGSQVSMEYIEFLRDEGKSVSLTTHHLDDADRLGTRFGLLHKGRLVIE